MFGTTGSWEKDEEGDSKGADDSDEEREGTRT
jgi:hypothetical protein